MLAGRNLDLGVGPANTDGTGVGIATVGNARNPALGFDGANIIAGAGLGPARGLAASSLDFENFVSEILTEEVLSNYLPELNLAEPVSAGDFASLPNERRNQIALEIFYRVLRDAGREATQAGGALRQRLRRHRCALRQHHRAGRHLAHVARH